MFLSPFPPQQKNMLNHMDTQLLKDLFRLGKGREGKSDYDWTIFNVKWRLWNFILYRNISHTNILRCWKSEWFIFHSWEELDLIFFKGLLGVTWVKQTEKYHVFFDFFDIILFLI